MLRPRAAAPLVINGKVFNDMKRMVRKTGTVLTAGLVLAVAAGASGIAGVAEAKAVSDRLKVACSGDYKRFCNGYKLGSSSLRSCMRSAGKRLSQVCIRALVDEGEVPRSALRNMR